MTENVISHPVEFWLTREQVAERLGCSARTVDRMLDRGELPRSLVSKRLVRIPESALQSLIEKKPSPAPGSEEGLDK